MIFLWNFFCMLYNSSVVFFNEILFNCFVVMVIFYLFKCIVDMDLFLFCFEYGGLWVWILKRWGYLMCMEFDEYWC